MYLIVGLGNPGKQYEYTRHNLGFLVVQHLVAKLGVSLTKSSFTKGLISKGVWENKKIWFLLPTTFMNVSGIAVRKFLAYQKFSLENMLIICDDLNLDFGQLRLRTKGGAGGHNGLKSIIQHCGTQEFARLRMGISHPGASKDVVDYVLKDFSKEEKEELGGFILQAAECCFSWMTDGINRAMEKHNKK